MKPRDLIDFLGTLEKLKCNTRHSWTSTGRRESVAEHSWRLAVMAMLCRDEYPTLDMDRVAKMCLIHDIGEAVLGDIPSFYKTESDEAAETAAVAQLLTGLPTSLRTEWQSLYAELSALETAEAKLFKALDNMEAVLSHNEAPLETWLPLEFTENLRYGEENVAWSAWTRELKETLNGDSREKIAREGAAASNENDRRKPMILSQNHIAINVSNRDKAVAFYRDVLGFTIRTETPRPDRQDILLFLEAHGVVLELFVNPALPARLTYPEALGLRHLCFTVTDIEKERERIAGLGYAPEEIRVLPDKKMFFVLDPDGLPIEFNQDILE